MKKIIKGAYIAVCIIVNLRAVNTAFLGKPLNLKESRDNFERP